MMFSSLLTAFGGHAAMQAENIALRPSIDRAQALSSQNESDLTKSIVTSGSGASLVDRFSGFTAACENLDDHFLFLAGQTSTTILTISP
jgi:hypothetical protein